MGIVQFLNRFQFKDDFVFNDDIGHIVADPLGCGTLVKK